MLLSPRGANRIAPGSDVSSSRRFFVQHAVPVKNDGGFSLEERFGQRQSVQRADAVIAMIGDVSQQLPLVRKPRVQRLLHRDISFGQEIDARFVDKSVTDFDALESRSGAAPVIDLDVTVCANATLLRV